MLQFCQKKLVKMFIFYIKIIDIVLLRTTFRGIGAYFRMFVRRVGPSPPPPLEKINVVFLIGDLLIHVATFLPIFCYLSPCPWGGGIFGLPPLLTKIIAGTMQWCSGKILLWNAIMALWSHILSL